jgi:mono/diheme cytochrome c family protein
MLKSPYQNPDSVAEEGLEIFRSLDCNGCHGGGGGIGMAAALTNPVWIYGNGEDTLFRVIALGTGSLSPDEAFSETGQYT